MKPKGSNPKDTLAGTRLPVELVPDSLDAEVCLAFLEGALKYGRYNWRIAGARASVYAGAARRHLMKWWNGEERDRKTHVRHLASAIASLAILIDAEICGMLEDDRPPSGPLSEVADANEEIILHLKNLFADQSPHQYTIFDEPNREPDE